MDRTRCVLALGIVLVTGASTFSCGSDDSPRSPGGTGGAPGGGDGSGGTSTPDAGSGGSNDTGGSGGSEVVPVTCGNGTVESPEECDDGNNVDKDGCDNSCRFTCTDTATGRARCTDHDFCNGEEQCDGETHLCLPSTGPRPDGAVCGKTSKCEAGVCTEAGADCGDTLVVLPEECDDGNQTNGDGCDDCRFSCLVDDKSRNCISDDVCAGQGQCIEATHTCKPGVPLPDYTPCGADGLSGCVAGACKAEFCSNGKVETGEECDDGNLANGDGCDQNCKYSCAPNDPARDCHSENECLNNGTCDPDTHRCSQQQPKTAGTACGQGGKNNCVHGNCLAPVCGDGIVAAGTEICDDGDKQNGDGCNDDCTVSCKTPATDCTATPACRTATCNGTVCGSAPDTSKNGQDCDTGGGAAKCNAGACTSGTCGNGTKETGEQCDDNNTIGKDGCEANCVYSCQNDASCNDGDDCNGVETCVEENGGKLCKPGTKKDDGTPCGNGTGTICSKGSCRPAFCGDDIKSGAEECEPPNTLACDSDCKARALCNLSGNWALQIKVDVSWGDGIFLSPHTGQIKQWALMNIVQDGTSTNISGSIKACGLSIPPFQSGPGLGLEWFGLNFDNAAFDDGTIPVSEFTGTVSNPLIGATVALSPVATLLGVRIATPPGPIGAAWPSTYNDMRTDPFTLSDDDKNGFFGISTTVASGEVPGMPGVMFKTLQCNIDPPDTLNKPGRCTRVDLAIRQTASNTGTVDTCTSLSGTTTASIVNHVVGCKRDNGNECHGLDEAKDKQTEINLIDAARPQYVISKAVFAAKVLPARDPVTCASVRRAYP